MPAETERQARAMRMAYAVKKGKLKKSKVGKNIKRMAKSMSADTIRDFMHTKEGALECVVMAASVMDKQASEHPLRAGLVTGLSTALGTAALGEAGLYGLGKFLEEPVGPKGHMVVAGLSGLSGLLAGLVAAKFAKARKDIEETVSKNVSENIKPEVMNAIAEAAPALQDKAASRTTGFDPKMYSPIRARREITPLEEAIIQKDKKKWIPDLIHRRGELPSAQMASPIKQGLLSGLLAGGLAGGAVEGGGKLYTKATGKPLDERFHYVAAGIAAVAALTAGLRTGIKRYVKNDAIIDTMMRMPPGATMRDIEMNPVYGPEENPDVFMDIAKLNAAMRGRYDIKDYMEPVSKGISKESERTDDDLLPLAMEHNPPKYHKVTQAGNTLMSAILNWLSAQYAKVKDIVPEKALSLK